VDGNIPEDERERLEAKAKEHSVVAKLAKDSPNFELFFADAIGGDSKDAAYPTDSSCARLQFYSWDKREAVIVTLDRSSGAVAYDPATSSHLYLTTRLKERAGEIALADPQVREAIGAGGWVDFVFETAGGESSCATNLCGVVSVVVADGTMRDRYPAVSVLVDLNRSLVTYFAADDEVLIDRRVE